MSNRLDELQSKLEYANAQVNALLQEKQELIEQNRALANDNTYLENYNKRLCRKIRTIGSITREESKSLRLSRRSRGHRRIESIRVILLKHVR